VWSVTEDYSFGLFAGPSALRALVVAALFVLYLRSACMEGRKGKKHANAAAKHPSWG